LEEASFSRCCVSRWVKHSLGEVSSTVGVPLPTAVFVAACIRVRVRVCIRTCVCW